MVLPIAEGRRYAIDSAQGTPFIDFLGFHCVLKRTVLGMTKRVRRSEKNKSLQSRLTTTNWWNKYQFIPVLQ